MNARLLASLLAAAALGSSSPASAGDSAWEVLPLGTSEDIVAIENTSFSEKWIVGTGGFAAQSSMSRTVWTSVDVGSTLDFTSIHQPSFGQVWIGGAEGVVRRLIMGTWEGANVPHAQTFSIFSRSSGQSWAVGREGSIYKTLNGSTWEAVQTVANGLNDGAGFLGGPAYAVGDGGAIFTTTDGDTWSPLSSTVGADLLAFLQAGGGALVAVGTGGTIVRSTDAGVSWNEIASGTKETLHGVSASKQNANWIVAVGEGGTVLRSTDAGASWSPLEPFGSETLLCVEAASNAEYIVGGAGGLLIRTTTGGVVPVERASWGELKDRFR